MEHLIKLVLNDLVSELVSELRDNSGWHTAGTQEDGRGGEGGCWGRRLCCAVKSLNSFTSPLMLSRPSPGGTDR